MQVLDAIQNETVFMMLHPDLRIVIDRFGGGYQNDFCLGGGQLGIANQLPPDSLFLVSFVDRQV
jgi:hypothetical protein